MFVPRRRLVPVLAGNNVKTAIAIQIGHGTRLVAAKVERMLAKGNLIGDLSPHRRQREAQQDNRYQYPSESASVAAIAQSDEHYNWAEVKIGHICSLTNTDRV